LLGAQGKGVAFPKLRLRLRDSGLGCLAFLFPRLLGCC
jgi:hypothetical protein